MKETMFIILGFTAGFVSYVICYTLIKPVTIIGTIGTLILSMVLSFLVEVALAAAVLLGAKK